MDKIDEIIMTGNSKKEKRKHFGASIKVSLFSRIDLLQITSAVSREGIIIAGVEAIEKRIEFLKTKV